MRRFAPVAVALAVSLAVSGSGLQIAPAEGARPTMKPKPTKVRLRSHVVATPIPTTADVNVLAYGADPTGVASSQTAFANALAAVPSGGWLYVPDGTYSIQQLVLPSNKGVRGQSKAGAILKRRAIEALDNTGDSHGFVYSNLTSGAKIKDLTLQGTRLLSGVGDDILLYLVDAAGFTAQNLTLKDADGIGIQTEGEVQMTGALVEDVTITDTVKRVNGAHGVGLWPYHGTVGNVFRRITVTRTESAGVTLDAGTTVGTGVSVDENTFEDLTINDASSIDILGGLVLTGARDNTFERVTIAGTLENCPIAFGDDQSGLGNLRNTFHDLDVEPLGGNLAVLSGLTEDNDFDLGTGSGVFIFTGAEVVRNNVTNWPAASGSWLNGAPSAGGDANTVS